MLNETMLKRWMRENNGGILYDPLHKGVFTGYVAFTPERAKIALENNTHNRKLGVKYQIPALQQVMENGLWDDNVAKINFDKTGTLSDGQNRLEACVRQQHTIRLLVTYGVEPSAQLSTDRRGTRTLSDDIEIAGYLNANRLAAMTRVIYSLNNGITPASIIANSSAKGSKNVDAILFKFFKDNYQHIEEKNKVVKKAINDVSDLGIPTSIMNVLAYEFDRINSDDARAFWERLGIGIATTEYDPIIMLRKRLVRTINSDSTSIPKVMLAALIIKTWNFYCRGETVGTLKFISGGANPEKFPEIYNPYSEQGETA